MLLDLEPLKSDEKINKILQKHVLFSIYGSHL
jgi:hypothetical protein